MIVIINILLLVAISYLGFQLLKTSLPNAIYWISLLLKLSAGVAMGLLFYEYYGEGDTIAFFEKAKSLIPIKSEPRTQFFVSFLKPFLWIAGGSYWLTSLWLSLISFLASWFASVNIIRYYPEYRHNIIACFLFIPSVVFWSAGIMKDTLAFAALIILVSQTITIYKSFKIDFVDALLIIISGWILFNIKHYLFIAALLFTAILLGLTILKKLKGSWKWSLSLTIILAAILGTQFVHPYLNLNRLPKTLFENSQLILQKSEPEKNSGVMIQDDSWAGVLKELPSAFHTGLFRPSVFDPTPIWGWIHKIENLILAALIVMSLILSLKLKPKVDWPLLLASFLSILLLATMLPLSTPNFGSLVRYKNAYMPFLFLISSILPYRYLTSKTTD